MTALASSENKTRLKQPSQEPYKKKIIEETQAKARVCWQSSFEEVALKGIGVKLGDWTLHSAGKWLLNLLISCINNKPFTCNTH